MILVLTGTPNGRSLIKGLERGGYRTLCSAATVFEAAEFGCGQTVTGALDRERLAELIRKYRVSGVMDALPENEAETSALAAEVCRNLQIPCLRYFPCRAEYLEDTHIVVCGDYRAVAERLNKSLGNALLFVSPRISKLIVENVLSRGTVFFPVLKGVEPDIDLPLRCGLQMQNILQVDGMESCNDIAAIMKKYDIQFIVCHGENGFSDKLEAAKAAGALVLLTGRYETTYPQTAYSMEEALEAANEWHLPAQSR